MADGARPVADLDLQGLSFGETQVLGALRLSVMPRETVAILGPSGIGKTSLLRVISGLETRYSGQRTVTSSLAYVFQEPTLLPWRSALANVTIPTRCGDSTARDRLADVGLEGLGDHYPGQLSLGQQRRLSLARAFAAKPELLVMDEPFVSLDASLVREMLEVFEHLRDAHGTTTIFVTHARDEADRLADRILTLDGRPATFRPGSG